MAVTLVTPFAGIIRSRFNGSAALLRDTLSLCDSAFGTAGWLPATSVRRNPKTAPPSRQDPGRQRAAALIQVGASRCDDRFASAW